jgi:hypothetical protein
LFRLPRRGAAGSLRRVWRLFIAHALRLIVVLCLGLAIVCFVLTVVGLALAATGRQPVAHPVYLGIAGAGVITLLAAVARLAHLALAHLVHLEPR